MKVMNHILKMGIMAVMATLARTAALLLLPALVHAAAGGGAERSGSFVIEYGNHRFRVVSPPRRSPQVGLVVENKTPVRIHGRAETAGGRVLHRVSVPPGGFRTVTVTLNRDERAVFVPLSPPMQTVELAFNRPPYEIPPRR